MLQVEKMEKYGQKFARLSEEKVGIIYEEKKMVKTKCGRGQICGQMGSQT